MMDPLPPAAPPARSGMPPWAKWTMFGCGGCLVLCLLVFGGCSAFFVSMLRGSGTFDVSDKPDPPLTATAGQLLPPKVDGFVRQSVVKFSQQTGSPAVGNGWQGIYTAGGKRVEAYVTTTASTRRARGGGSPFGNDASQQRGMGPNTGLHMSMNFGGQSVDLAIWSKPNWTFTIQSKDKVAMQFAKAYRPTAGAGS